MKWWEVNSKIAKGKEKIKLDSPLGIDCILGLNPGHRLSLWVIPACLRIFIYCVDPTRVGRLLLLTTANHILQGKGLPCNYPAVPGTALPTHSLSQAQRGGRFKEGVLNSRRAKSGSTEMQYIDLMWLPSEKKNPNIQ